MSQDLPRFADLRGMFGLAEEVDQSVARYRGRIATDLLVIAVGAAVLVGAVIASLDSRGLSIPAVLGGATAVVLAYFKLLTEIRGYRAEIQTYQEVSTLLRETYSLLVGQGLSQLETVEAEVRLSRLRLGVGSVERLLARQPEGPSMARTSALRLERRLYEVLVSALGATAVDRPEPEYQRGVDLVVKTAKGNLLFEMVTTLGGSIGLQSSISRAVAQLGRTLDDQNELDRGIVVVVPSSERGHLANGDFDLASAERKISDPRIAVVAIPQHALMNEPDDVLFHRYLERVAG